MNTWMPDNDATDNFTDPENDRWRDPHVCWEPRQQARKAARQRAKVAKAEARLARLTRIVAVLRFLSALTLWTALGSVIAAVLVCRNDDALLPMAGIVITCFLSHLGIKTAFVHYWIERARTRRGL